MLLRKTEGAIHGSKTTRTASRLTGFCRIPSATTTFPCMVTVGLTETRMPEDVRTPNIHDGSSGRKRGIGYNGIEFVNSRPYISNFKLSARTIFRGNGIYKVVRLVDIRLDRNEDKRTESVVDRSRRRTRRRGIHGESRDPEKRRGRRSK